MAATKTEPSQEKNTTMPQKKPLVVQYNKHANKAEIRSVTPKNVQENLEDMDLSSFKYNKLKAQQQKHQHMGMLDKTEES